MQNGFDWHIRLSICGNYIHEIYGPLNITIITAKDLILFYFILFEYKTPKNDKWRTGGWCCEASGWEVKKQPQSNWTEIKKYGLVPICHPIRDLCCLRASLICQLPFQSKHSHCIQTQANRLSLWICLFIHKVCWNMKTAGSNWFPCTIKFGKRKGTNCQE